MWQDAIGREVARGHLSVVDDKCTMIGLYLYEGLLKIIPVPLPATATTGPPEAFNVKIVSKYVVTAPTCAVVAITAVVYCTRRTN